MRVAFVVNVRNKVAHVARAVHGALSQTVACEVLLSDQNSDDGTMSAMLKAVDDFGPTHHDVKIMTCHIDGPFGMVAANAHFDWLCDQVSDDTEWIFQSSGDDYSLSRRVEVCMSEIDSKGLKPACVACTMFFEEPGATNRESASGYPKETGFVSAADGLMHLAYGSTIHGWNREFLKKVKHMPKHNTPDVLLGFLASLDAGFYVVAKPCHVHCTHAGVKGQLGFQGKMRAAQGEDALRIGELNHMQLCSLYSDCFDRAYELHADGIPNDAYQALMTMILSQSRGWLEARRKLHELHIRPYGMDDV